MEDAHVCEWVVNGLDTNEEILTFPLPESLPPVGSPGLVISSEEDPEDDPEEDPDY